MQNNKIIINVFIWFCTKTNNNTINTINTINGINYSITNHKIIIQKITFRLTFIYFLFLFHVNILQDINIYKINKTHANNKITNKI